MRSREELAWAAGFFDGEGSVGVFRNRGDGCYPQIQIGQVDREVLDHFQQAVGIGRVAGPYNYRNGLRPNNKDFWKYSTAGFERVQAILAMLWPWLGEIKREQFKKVLHCGQR